jgi:hypothetical protein
MKPVSKSSITRISEAPCFIGAKSTIDILRKLVVVTCRCRDIVDDDDTPIALVT